jgi:heme-degrading monooxygenase HmoA
LRDQFSIRTWLIVGALLQGTAHALLPYRNIVIALPVILFLLYKAAATGLVLTGVLPNPLMRDVIPYGTGVVYPSMKGTHCKAGDHTVCAIVLGVVSHHPLGMFGPGFKEVSDRFEGMVREMSADATKHGFLGASNWINASERTTSNQFASILYFENEDYLHAYAHGPLHSKTTQWWRENAKDLKTVGIMHEVFACPKKSWEAVYLNYHPTG